MTCWGGEWERITPLCCISGSLGSTFVLPFATKNGNEVKKEVQTYYPKHIYTLGGVDSSYRIIEQVLQFAHKQTHRRNTSSRRRIMDIKTFKVERWMDEYETKCEYNLAVT